MIGAPDEKDSQRNRLRQLFRQFGTMQARGKSAVYEALSEAVARDDAMLDLLLHTPDEQRRPSLLFASVNLLLSSLFGAELARYCPIHGGTRAPDDRLVPAFAAFCAEHRDALARLLRERSTQTNEIRRCVALRLGLEHVRRRWPGPLALVEIGASAGLNLVFDRYRYRLNGRETEPGTSSVTISCEVKDARGPEILGSMPEIAGRLGIDQKPVDLADPAARAWLEAFIWPEQVEDLANLRAAIALVRATPGARVAPGNATRDTARILSELPGREPVVVFTASLLSYLSTADRLAFVAQLDEAARHRAVAWVFAETPGLLATTGLDIAALAGPLARRNSLYLIGASLRGHERRGDTLLALADPYVRWLAPARGAADDFAWVPAEPPA